MLQDRSHHLIEWSWRQLSVREFACSLITWFVKRNWNMTSQYLLEFSVWAERVFCPGCIKLIIYTMEKYYKISLQPCGGGVIFPSFLFTSLLAETEYLKQQFVKSTDLEEGRPATPSRTIPPRHPFPVEQCRDWSVRTDNQGTTPGGALPFLARAGSPFSTDRVPLPQRECVPQAAQLDHWNRLMSVKTRGHKTKALSTSEGKFKFIRYYLGENTKKCNRAWPCSTHGRDKKCKQKFYWIP